MKILLSAKHDPEKSIGGVQSWCRTVADELRGRGHTVLTWGVGSDIPLGGFDLGILANLVEAPRPVSWCRKSISVCHGIIPAEKPFGKKVVFTSEGVRDYWGWEGPIIRQPIDLNFWCPAKAQRKYLTRFSYRTGLNFLPKVAQNLNLQYRHVRNAHPNEAREILRQSVCVIATGRAALEAMACGVPVVLADHRASYQGPLMDLDTLGAMRRNYSGRGGVAPSQSNVTDAVKNAIALGGLRFHVSKHHDVKAIVDQLLDAA